MCLGALVCVLGSGMGLCLGVWDGYVSGGLGWVCVWGLGWVCVLGSGMGMCLRVWDGYVFRGLGWVFV